MGMETTCATSSWCRAINSTLYCDFLMRHELHLWKNPRMSMWLKNLDRFAPAQREAIRVGAVTAREQCGQSRA